MSAATATARPMTPEYWTQFGSLVSSLKVEVSRLQVTTGEHLHLYEAGPSAAERVVVVSPAEGPFLLMAGVCQHLSRDYRVAAWDSPASPFLDAEPGLSPVTLPGMARNLVDIVHAKDMRRLHLVAWCAGAVTVLWSLSIARLPVASVTFIAPPSALSRCSQRTAFQSDFLRMALELAGGKCSDEAALCARIRAAPLSRPADTPEERALMELTGLTLRNDDSTRRYAQLVANTCASVPPSKAQVVDRAYVELLADISKRIPVAILHCRDDDIVSYRCSVEAVEDNDTIRLVLYPKGGHFVVFSRPEMIGADVASFIRTSSAAS